MKRKTEAAYRKVFKFLKEIFLKNVTAITTDYEKAIGDAAEFVYPGIEKKKCYFHFTQVSFIMGV